MNRVKNPVSGLIALCSIMTAANLEAKQPPQKPDPTFLREMTVTHNFMLGRPTHLRFLPDGNKLLFLRAGAENARSNLYIYDVRTEKERLLLSAETLLGGAKEQLSVAEKAERERKRIKTAGFTSFRMSSDGRRVMLKLSGKVWIVDIESAQGAVVETPEGAVLNPRLSPDGRKLAFVQNNNLRVLELGATSNGKIPGTLIDVTSDGTPDRPHGVPEFVAQEEMSRFDGFWWSPESDALLFQSNDYSQLERLTIADASRPEKPAVTFPYPRAGKTNATVRLRLFSLAARTDQPVSWDAAKYPYLAKVVWSRNAPPVALVQSRHQQDQALLQIDQQTGRTTTLHAEHDDAWLNIHSSTPRFLPDGKSYLYATEADGSWRLERHVLGKGAVQVTPVLPGSANFHSIVHVDAKRDRIWFLGGEDPTELHLFHARLSQPGKIVQLSPAGGYHSAHISGDGSAIALTRTTLHEMPLTYVTGTSNLSSPSRVSSLPTLEENAKEPTLLPNVEFVSPERAANFHAMILRPKTFTPGRKYPVVLYVYGGPHHQVVIKQAARHFMQQWIAEHGFVVVSLDGRGTPRRGRAHERAIREKFGSVPLEDQVKGLRALAQHYPELDLDRVGVYGWSFGGYLAALAALKRPDVFKVGVAGAPVVDWEYYDTHYTERYMGLPNETAEAYRQSNLLTHASELERPLMLVHGIADDNVYFAHTLQLADALFRAGKPYALVPLVGLTHQVADPKVRETLYSRMVSFLGQALW